MIHERWKAISTQELTQCMESYYFTFLNEEHNGVKIETADSDVKENK
jgi:hypothetical protein